MSSALALPAAERSRALARGAGRAVSPARPLLLCLLLTGCGGASDTAADRGTSSAEAKQARETENCQNTRVSLCRTLRVDDRGVPRTVRYAVIRPRRAHAYAPAVLVDLGGPGLAIFGQQWPGDRIRTLLPATLRDSALVLIEEPWVTGTETPSCRRETAQLFTQAHLGHPTTKAAAVGRSCGIFASRNPLGWTPAFYDETVGAIATKERLSIDGFVGASFAARRLTYLRHSAPRWAALVNPAPRDSSGAAYLTGRRAAVLRSTVVRCAGCVAEKRLVARLKSAARRLVATSRTVAGRSVPVTATDLGAALFASAYLPRKRVAGSVSSLLHVGRSADARRVGSLADGVWTRFGVNDVSPAYLGYLAEVCASYPQWPGTSKAVSNDPVRGFLTAFHAPCAHAGTAATSRFRAGTSSRTRVCVSSLAADPVTPTGAAASWKSNPHTTVLPPTPGDEHDALSGVTDCLGRLDVTRP